MVTSSSAASRRRRRKPSARAVGSWAEAGAGGSSCPASRCRQFSELCARRSAALSLLESVCVWSENVERRHGTSFFFPAALASFFPYKEEEGHGKNCCAELRCGCFGSPDCILMKTITTVRLQYEVSNADVEHSLHGWTDRCARIFGAWDCCNPNQLSQSRLYESDATNVHVHQSLRGRTDRCERILWLVAVTTQII